MNPVTCWCCNCPVSPGHLIVEMEWPRCSALGACLRFPVSRRRRDRPMRTSGRTLATPAAMRHPAAGTGTTGVDVPLSSTRISTSSRKTPHRQNSDMHQPLVVSSMTSATPLALAMKPRLTAEKYESVSPARNTALIRSRRNYVCPSNRSHVPVQYKPINVRHTMNAHASTTQRNAGGAVFSSMKSR